MKVKARVTETLIIAKDVEVEVPDDAEDEQVEEAIRDAAYENTVFEGGSGCWEGVDTTHVTIDWHRAEQEG